MSSEPTWQVHQPKATLKIWKGNLPASTYQKVHRHLMQCFLEGCLGSVAGLTDVHASFKTSLKADHIIAFHPCKLLSAKEVHRDLPWGLTWHCTPNTSSRSTPQNNGCLPFSMCMRNASRCQNTEYKQGCSFM